MFRAICILTMVILVNLPLVGCGPEQPAIDRTKDELIKRNEKDVAALPAVTGFYTGIWVSPDGVKYKAAVSLYLTKERRKLPLEGEEIEVTVLKGSIYLYEQDPRLAVQGMGAVLSGNYDPATGRLVLSLGPVQGSPTNDQREFSGLLKNETLEGTLPIKGTPTALKVRLVEKL